MSERRWPPDHPQAWLNRARSSLCQAKARIPGVCFEDLCFAAQQAAEKAFKALLLHLGTRIPYTHDLAELLVLVEGGNRTIPESIRRTVILSDYAVEARYPGVAEPVTEQEYEEATALAENAVRWVEVEMGAAQEPQP